ncbi:DUF4123 domain-containing protein [Exilibacterium tricleocarpae]|uniref:DUF4123 domain-containing protein n=1 Tax=Exilibacterium tricleocarpae TaxID=2591008 RepID=A0A545U479_9GAMM|nr:DUF4123 domain-containing protein [Exilibacterium tricleocarpae]TQV84275.1 DUF4123 domain-containing protein [Exilibacterium tricleocarpae]
MVATPGFSSLQRACPGFKHHYALLDCAIDNCIYPAIKGSGHWHQCLYRNTDEVLEKVAPHVVSLKAGGFCDWLFSEGWGQSWGIYIASDKNLVEILRHFRQVNKVRGPGLENWLFRYYDPRILRDFLPSSDGTQQYLLMGSIGPLWMESEDGQYAVKFDRGPAQLRIENRDWEGVVSAQRQYPQVAGEGDASSILRIRQDQVQLLAKTAYRAFVRMLVGDMQRCYPKRLAAYDNTVLYRRIDQALQTFRSMGVKKRQDGYYCVEMCVLMGWDFMESASYGVIRRDFLENIALGDLSQRVEAAFQYCKDNVFNTEAPKLL